MNKKETRFFERKSFLIDFNSFTEVMQELLDDSTLRIEEGYSALSMYSEGYDCCYDEDEVIERIGIHLNTNIIACYKDADLKQIYFMCGTENNIHCLYCNFFDRNDSMNAMGTCEPQDTDFHATHECNLSAAEIKELESLTQRSRKMQ